MKFLYLIPFIFVSLHLKSQAPSEENSSLSGDSIHVIGNVTENNIQLRWAPSGHISWSRLNEYGYTIERITVVRDGDLLPKPESTILSAQPIKPLPMENWENIVDVNDWGAIAAQALYGDDFKLTTGEQTDVFSMVNISKEQRQRFSFALFAADQSFEIAQMAGLGFVDRTAEQEEKYVYRIISNVPNEIDSIESGNIYIGLSDYTELPKPYGLNAVFSDKLVTLSWEQENFYGIFNSYIVEKSTDGINYKSITKKPIVNSFNDQLSQSRLGYKSDSLLTNDKIYYYRVRGISPFGQISNPSDSIFGKGFSPLSSPPSIINWSAQKNQIKLEWSFPMEDRNKIEGFYIEKGLSADGPFNNIGTVDGEKRNFNDDNPDLTNYYRVVAFVEESRVASFPILAQLEDSIPPSAPVNLKYVISSEGEVYLSWKDNTENDLLGYRVYRSNFENSEFSEITKNPSLKNNFTDEVAIKNLTKSIYYQIRAIDMRYNPSEPSKILTVRKPDFVIPVPPLLNSIKSDEIGVHIGFIPSSSDDVKKHQIYRKKEGEENWVKVAEKEISEQNIFLDKELILNETYYYKIVAIDDTDLSSEPSQEVAVTYKRLMADNIAFDLKARFDANNKSIILNFDCEKEIKQVKIYRGKDNESPSFYMNLESNSNEFVDNKILQGASYVYAVQIIFIDGLVSQLMTVSI